MPETNQSPSTDAAEDMLSGDQTPSEFESDGSDDTDKIRIFSLVPYRWSIPVRADRENSNGKCPILGTVRLSPGINYVSAELWDKVDKSQSGIQRRMSKGQIKTSEPTENEKRAVSGTPDPKMWTKDLCEKSQEVPEVDTQDPNQIFE